MRQALHRYEVVVKLPKGSLLTFYVVSHGLIAAANTMQDKGELVSITQKEIITKLALPLDSALD